MSVLRTWAAVAVGMLCIASLGYAKPQYDIEQGPCDVGSSVWAWWSVTSIDEKGRVVEVWRVDCSGSAYHYNFTVRPLPADPTMGLGVAPDITGIGEGGNAYAIMTYYDANNSLTSCAGRDSNGEFWETTINN